MCRLEDEHTHLYREVSESSSQKKSTSTHMLSHPANPSKAALHKNIPQGRASSIKRIYCPFKKAIDKREIKNFVSFFPSSSIGATGPFYGIKKGKICNFKRNLQYTQKHQMKEQLHTLNTTKRRIKKDIIISEIQTREEEH